MNRNRIAGLILSLFMLASAPSIAGAQFVSPTDPCFKVLTDRGNLTVLTQMELTDRDRLLGALLAIGSWTGDNLRAVQERVASAAAGTALTADERAQYQRIRDCLNWLRDVLDRLNKQMAQYNMNTLEVPRRGGRTQASARSDLVKAILDDIATIRTEIAKLLSRRE